jgi:hypothetical protein
MSSDINQNRISTQEDCSLGGKIRAANLTPERRKEISFKASHSRKCMKGIPKATHSGELIIGTKKILCAVLDNGKRVINESGMFEALNMSRAGRRGPNLSKMPRFLAPINLKPFIPKDLDEGSISFEFISFKGPKAHGYDATIISDICKIYLDARRAGVLTETQEKIAFQCEIILQALSKVGIIALIDSCTGYEKQRESDELQNLFSKFIAQELQPWVKRFPTDFFIHLKRMYGLKEMKGNPSFFGCLINRWIYRELSPEILDELKRLNPITESGRRKHPHHQLLTQDIGCPALDKQIQKVTTLLSVSDTKEDFEKLLERSKEKDLSNKSGK